MDQEEVSARIRFVKDSWKDRAGEVRIGSGEDRRAQTSFQDVRIANARPLLEQGELDLDRNGFILTHHETSVRDFSNREEVETTYYAEVCALVKALTGAAVTVPLNYLTRSEKRGDDWIAAYARYVHLDCNEKMSKEWIRRTRDMGSLADVLECTRDTIIEFGFSSDPPERYTPGDSLASPPYSMAIYMCWQPIEHEVQRNPLTLIDPRSFDNDAMADYVLDGTYGDYQGALGAMPFHHPEQRLYYFPRMQTDELLLFKQIDTRPLPARQGCPHTSFDDPTSPLEPLGRRNVEVPVVAIFGSAT